MEQTDQLENDIVHCKILYEFPMISLVFFNRYFFLTLLPILQSYPTYLELHFNYQKNLCESFSRLYHKNNTFELQEDLTQNDIALTKKMIKSLQGRTSFELEVLFFVSSLFGSIYFIFMVISKVDSHAQTEEVNEEVKNSC